MPNLKKVEGERGLYINPDSGSYFVRVQNPRDTFISLGTKRKGEALKRMDVRRAAKAAAKMGIALEPDEPARQVTVAEVVRRYETDDYPDRKGNPRADTPHRRSEKDASALLLKFFKDDRLIDGLNQNVLDQHHDWRRKGVVRGDGHRTTDLELNALSNALNWAVRKELIKVTGVTVVGIKRP